MSNEDPKDELHEITKKVLVDQECRSLCRAINHIEGIKTTEIIDDTLEESASTLQEIIKEMIK